MAGRIVQEPPFAVQVELAEGCQLRCSFCGLNGIRGKDNAFKFMTLPTIRSLARQIVKEGWNPRVEFAMHGEPTMHPNYHAMIRAFREEAPRLQLMMTSNGGGLLRPPGPVDNVLGLFTDGLNVLALDDYQNVKIVPKIRDALLKASEGEPGVLLPGLRWYEYPRDRDGSPHARRSLKEHVVTFIEAIDVASIGTHSTLNNHAGAAAPLDFSKRGHRCAKPFRELSVRWDGNVSVCCNDWRGSYKCGNIVSDGLDAVWNSPAMQAARKKLYHGQRDFGPCNGCNAVSYRVGLLPDKLGKQKLPVAGVSDRAAIKAALLGQPYTAPVKREWETEK